MPQPARRFTDTGGSMSERPSQPRFALDPILKFLLDRDRDELLRLILGAQASATVVEELNPVVAAGELRADALLLVEEHGDRYVLHTEFQSLIEPERMPSRIFHYAARIHQRTELPVRSAVIYLLEPSATTAIPTQFEMRIGGRTRMLLAYDVVKLWDIEPERERLQAHPVLLALTPLMKGVTATDVERLARIAIDAHWEPREKTDALGLLALLGGRRFGREVLSSLTARIAMLRDIIQESPLYQMAREEGEARGEARGRVEGQARGRLEGLRSGCLALLAAKCGGELPDDAGERIRSIGDAGVLERLLVELGSAADAEAALAAISRRG